MGINKIFIRFYHCILVVVLLVSFNIHANEKLSPWSFSGFGTLGLAGTDTDAIGFSRDIFQQQELKKSPSFLTDSRLGLQLDYRFNEAISFSAQWILKDQVSHFFEQNLERAFVRWKPRYDIDLRLGRLGVDVYSLSDFRNVSYSYLWMRPPHSFYAYLPITHFDGLDVTQHFTIGEGIFSLKFFGGYSFASLLARDIVSDIELVNMGTSMDYNVGSWRLKSSYTYLYIMSELTTKSLTHSLKDPLMNQFFPDLNRLLPQISTKGARLHFFSLGTEFDDGVWLAQAEVSYMESDLIFVPSLVGGYLSIGRRFSNITLYSVVGITHSFPTYTRIPTPVISNSETQAVYQTYHSIFNRNGTDQKSVSIGARWDVYSNIALKAQWSYFWLDDRRGAVLWQQQKPIESIPNQVNVWSLGIDFVF